VRFYAQIAKKNDTKTGAAPGPSFHRFYRL